jgi:hypothetical protein
MLLVEVIMLGPFGVVILIQSVSFKLCHTCRIIVEKILFEQLMFPSCHVFFSETSRRVTNVVQIHTGSEKRLKREDVKLNLRQLKKN